MDEALERGHAGVIIDLRVSCIEVGGRYDTRWTTEGRDLEREEKRRKPRMSPTHTSSSQPLKITALLSVVLSTICYGRALFTSHWSNNMCISLSPSSGLNFVKGKAMSK